MFVVIVGCGRVGSSLARTMLADGHEVSCLDEDPEAHARLEIGLDKAWEDMGGQFTVGAALEVEALDGGRSGAGGCVRRVDERRQHEHRDLRSSRSGASTCRR